ncbi:hypothetical protein D7X33_31920 [Butyricicoccus sp. 1XD8-22]|nr:hypothetical protein D7X33_31920 [Butyricicoccus sp. 1XD8-22]
MKIRKEYNVDGEYIKGRIIGNWSAKSEFAIKITKIEEFTLGEQELDQFINELLIIKEQISKENEDFTIGNTVGV